MRARKTVLTTGDVARICSVAPRTVSKWFDSGHLRGYRIPGSKDRRIPIEHLVRFMRAHGIPLNGLESGHRSVLVLDGDATTGQAIQESLGANDAYEVVMTSTALEAGAAAQQMQPHVFIVDITLPDVTPQAVTRFIRALATPEPTCVIGIAPGLTESQGQSLLQSGFDGYLSKPFDLGSLIHLIEEATTVPVGESAQTHPS